MFMRVFQCCVLAFLIFNTSGIQQKNKILSKYKKPIARQIDENQSGSMHNETGYGLNDDDDNDEGEYEDNRQEIEDDVNGNDKPNAYDEGSTQKGELMDEQEEEEDNRQEIEDDVDGNENPNANDEGSIQEGELMDEEEGEVPDILPSAEELLDRNKPEPGLDLSHAEMMKFKLWPNAFIPYYIDVHSFSDKVLRDKIRSFLSSVNSLTTLNFVELPSPPRDNSRWVLFMNRRGLLGCADHSVKNFTNSGVQHVILGYDCMSTEGELSEAVLSIAGVPAQHNAPDRDDYVKVNSDNIIPEKRYLFDKLSNDDWLFRDLEYDFHSAGHFHSYRHSLNGRATLEPTEKAKEIVLGQAKELSALDIKKIRMLYNYIVKKRLLEAPNCHKLFEPGKKFNEYASSEVDLKPRDKLYRYTGEKADAPLEIPEDKKNVDDVVLPGHQFCYTNGTVQYDNNNNSDVELLSEAVENDDAIKPKIVNIHDKGEVQVLKAPLKKKMLSVELLSYMSDYLSDDERRKMNEKEHNRIELKGHIERAEPKVKKTQV